MDNGNDKKDNDDSLNEERHGQESHNPEQPEGAEDTRQPRDETPQFQHPEDRLAALSEGNF